MLKQFQMFESNSHSKYQIGWKPVTEQVEATVKEILQVEYGLVGVASVEQVCEWEVMSNNFRVRFSDGKTEDVLMRKHIQHGDATSLTIMNSAMDFLYHRGIMVPRTICASGLRQVVWHEPSSSYWQVFKFIPGDHYCGSEEELADAARHVARLNRAMKGLLLDPAISDLELRLTLPRWKEFIEAGSGSDLELDHLLVECEELVSKQIAAVERVPYPGDDHEETQQVLHTDLHPLNFIFQDGCVRAILDFGNMVKGNVCVDVANACHRLVRQHVVYQGAPWQETLAVGVSIFFESYLSENPGLREELKRVPYFMKDKILRNLEGCLSLYRAGKWTHEVALKEITKQTGLLLETDLLAMACARYFR